MWASESVDGQMDEGMCGWMNDGWISKGKMSWRLGQREK